MPELPEVEAVRRQLEPAMVGARIERVELRRPDLRAPFPRRFAQRLAGATTNELTRRAKYLVAALSSGDIETELIGIVGVLGFTGVGPGEHGGRDRVVRERVGPPRLLRIEVGGGVEVGDLAGDRHGEVAGVEPADRPDAVATRGQARPEVVDPGADRGDRPDAGDDDATAVAQVSSPRAWSRPCRRLRPRS